MTRAERDALIASGSPRIRNVFAAIATASVEYPPKFKRLTPLPQPNRWQRDELTPKRAAQLWFNEIFVWEIDTGIALRHARGLTPLARFKRARTLRQLQGHS